MSQSRRKLGVAAAALGVGAALWAAVHFGWYKPRADSLRETYAKVHDEVTKHRAALDNHPRLQRDLKEIVNRTLGADVETVDHRLRTRLNRIAEQLQLQKPTVSTSRPSAQRNPARLVFPRSMPELRDEVDFVELDGSITASGSLEQVIALVDQVNAEPWIKRIHELRLDPKDNGQQVAVTLRLTTLFLPGQTPEVVPEGTYDGQRLVKFASLVEGNPFRIPPRIVEAPAASPKPSRPAKPRAEQWMVTGIAHGPGGTEAWLRNARSGESKRVALGQRVAEAVLVAVTGDAAEFELDQQRLVVAVGGVLSLPPR